MNDTKRWIERIARYGYASKGAVYFVVGFLATKAAIGAGGSQHDAQGAIKEIGSQPYGKILLAVVALGLLGHVGWRAVQAIFDPEGAGEKPTALVKRAGFAVSAIVHLLLAFTALSIVVGWGSGGSGREKGWTATLMSLPFGPVLVGLAGAAVLGAGFAQFYRAYKASFMKHYNQREMGGKTAIWAERIGRFGLAARGVTFSIIGIFLIVAAVKADPGQAKGLGEALQTLAAQPYGIWLFGITAIGFMAYGMYCFANARYRRFPGKL